MLIHVVVVSPSENFTQSFAVYSLGHLGTYPMAFTEYAGSAVNGTTHELVAKIARWTTLQSDYDPGSLWC